MNQPQKYSRRDPFPQLPFHCEEIEGVPTWSDALGCVLVVALLTVLFGYVLP
jgi:hypothetical protein